MCPLSIVNTPHYQKALRFPFGKVITDGRAMRITALTFLFFIIIPNKKNCTPRKVEEYFSSWVAKYHEIVILHDTTPEPAAELLKLFHKKGTVWTNSHQFQNLAEFVDLFRETRSFNDRALVFACGTGSKLTRLFLYILFSPHLGILTHWVLLLDEGTFESIKRWTPHMPPRLSVCVFVGGYTAPHMIVSCVPNREEKLPKLTPSRYQSQDTEDISYFRTVSWQNLRLGCVSHKYKDQCKAAYHNKVIDLLSQKKANITLFRYVSLQDIFDDFWRGRIDVIVGNVGFDYISLRWNSFADVEFGYKTFYALANSTRVLSMIEAMGSSSCVVLALLCLLLCSMTIAAARVTAVSRHFIFILSEEALFLLAPLLSTSSPVPRLGREVNIRLSVYALWLALMLSFSVYLRSELTSMVTVLRPADHIDTLAKLEKGLDDDKVLLCVTKQSSDINYLKADASSAGVSVDKLRGSYLKNINKIIVKNSQPDCLRCALGKNRVCLAPKFPFCVIKQRFPHLGVSQDHIRGEVKAFAVQKEFALSRTFIRFMRSIREGHLLKTTSDNCETSTLSSRSTLELWSFLREFFALHFFSSLVLVAEIIIGRLFGTSFGDKRLE